MLDRESHGRCAEERRRLGVLLSLYFQALLWIADWCRQTTDGVPAKDVYGFVIHGAELDDLKVDREELLSHMATGSTHPWVRSTQAYDYVRPDGSVESAVPGKAVDGLRVERVQIKPYPKHLPYSQFMSVFCEVCAYFGRDYRDVLFRYRGCLCEDPLRLVRIFRGFECERCVVMQAIQEWYACICQQLPQWTPAGESEAAGAAPDRPPSELPPPPCETCPPPPPPPDGDPFDLGITDPRILSLKLTRPKMAEFLNCSVRTLRRWEQAGEAPGGWPWPRPEKVGGNLVLYDVARYWDTIRKLQPRLRDLERDGQLREEILSEKYALRE